MPRYRYSLFFILILFLCITSCSDDDNIEVLEMEASCLPPSNIQATVIDYNETLISWDASSTNEVSYEIEYGVTGFTLGDGIMKPAAQDELLLDALIVGTTYDYYIKSICEEDEISAFSSREMFTTRACELPSSFIVDNITPSSVVASWEGNGEVSWELEYGLEGFQLGEGEVIFLAETNVVIDPLMSNTAYQVYLRANCGPNGQSDYLTPVSFTTL